MVESICRLCLRTTPENFPILEDDLRAVLDIFLLKPVLYISQLQNIICSDCWNNLQVFYHFKRACVDIRDGALPASSSDFNLDMDNIKNKQISPFSKDLTCHFCTKFIGKQCFISLIELKKNTSVVNLLEKHSSELSLNNSEKIVSCESCHVSFQVLQNFIMNCFNVQEKIGKYAEAEGADNNGKIDLKKIREFTFVPALQLNTECSSIFKMETMDLNHELFDIKSVKCENDDDLQSIIKDEEVDIKSEEDDESKGHSEKQISTYKVPLGTRSYKCKKCEFETMNTISMKQHMVIHKERLKRIRRRNYKCKECPYETIYWLSISNHKLTHMDPLDIPVYKCEVCEYETKQKLYLKRHMTKHKELSERKRYKCKECEYETISTSSMWHHMLTHSEKKKYTCKVCTYETHLSGNFKQHMMIHKDLPERRKYKCNECSYETISTASLWRHTFTHKDPSKIIVYKCDICTYETKFKGCLKRHMLSHKDLESQTFIRKSCPYETITKTIMQPHTMTHKTDSTIPMHQYEICECETKYKNSMRRHMVTHKNPSEIRKCKYCSNEAINVSSMKWHLVTHKEPPEITVHKCELCAYETKYISNFKKHIKTKIHKDASEIRTRSTRT